MSKIIKDSLLNTVLLFLVIVVLKIIFKFKWFVSIFEEGWLMGIGILITALVILFLIILTINLIKNICFK